MIPTTHSFDVFRRHCINKNRIFSKPPSKSWWEYMIV